MGNDTPLTNDTAAELLNEKDAGVNTVIGQSSKLK
jgi:hypothetical protein